MYIRLHLSITEITQNKVTNLVLRSSDLSAFSIALQNRLTNQTSEYWYMGSMDARSEIQKNRIPQWTAIFVYPILAASIFFSVS